MGTTKQLHMGKRGPKKGTGGRPRVLPPEVSAQHGGGSPKVFFRLDPDVFAWLSDRGGPLYAKHLVVEAYERREGAVSPPAEPQEE